MIEEVRKLRNRQPFLPYTIILTDGEKIRITDQFHVGFGGSTIGIYDESHDRFLPLPESSVAKVLAEERIDQVVEQS